MIKMYLDKVRVRHASVDFGSDDIIVEKLDGDVWVKVAAFNSLSDDYAHSNAKDFAFKLSRSK